MKNLTKFILMLLSFCGLSIADTYESAITDVFVPTVSSMWLEPYDKNFLPYDICRNITDVKITKIQEQKKYFWTPKKNLYSIDHFHNLVSVVKVNYKVTCRNKLSYAGIEFLFSENHQLNEAWASESTSKEFKSHAHGYVNKPLDYIDANGVYYDKVDPEFSTYTKFDKDSIALKWYNQKVEYPEWVYTGKPGKTLAHPVMFVHGLNSDFKVWGVEPKESGKKNVPTKSLPDFQKGLVKSYQKGSAPDILARTYNIPNTGAHINKNGIYFYQAPGKIANGNDWREAEPAWSANPSQSKKLYERIVEIMDDFYGSKNINWREIDDTYIDLVGHSQGGLTIREMFRGLKDDAGKYPVGCANAANHVRKVVTVDTPHFGSELATENPEKISKDLSGLKLIIEDLEASKKGNPPEHELVDVDLDLGWVEYASAVKNKQFNSFMENVDHHFWKEWGVTQEAYKLLGWAVGFITYPFESIKLRINGPYIGKYKATVSVEGLLFDQPAKDIELDQIEPYADEAYATRQNGIHLDPGGEFMFNLNKVKNGKPPYPEKPNGEQVEMQTLYSPKTTQVLAKLLSSVAEGAERLCEDMEDESSGCFVIGPYFEQIIVDMSKKEGFNIDDASINTINSNLWKALVNIQDSWFGTSDALVTEYSQKFEDENLGITPEKIPAFSKPRRFVFHDALAPWEDILHGPLDKGNIHIAGASRQGLDIACVLDTKCNEVAQNNTSKVLYLNFGSVDFVGDFSVAPIFLNQGTQEIIVSDDTYYLTASYIPGVGSVVTYTDNNGVLHKDILADSSVATSPSLKRDGHVIHVTFTNQSGKTFEKDYDISNLSDSTKFTVVVNTGETPPSVVIGTGTAADSTTQIPPVSPKDKFVKNSDVIVVHREARGYYEKNTSRPRILIANSSKKDIVGFKIAYYFTGDPAHKPVVEVDYPKIPITLENLGGDQWRFILDASNQVLTAGNILPNLDGWQIRIHYEDWTNYKFINDWSANHNYGIPTQNPKIVVYDLNDNVIWGIEPSAYKSVDDGIIPQATATMAWYDTAPYEKNHLKPSVTIKNTGSIALQNYKAKLWFRVPEGKKINVPVEDWYTPISTPSLKNVGENVWELSMDFNKYILYPGESVTEGNIGIHLKDWSNFDKTVCGIALLDSENNVIYGSAPTIEHCKSFNEPSLLTPIYTWNY